MKEKTYICANPGLLDCKNKSDWLLDVGFLIQVRGYMAKPLKKEMLFFRESEKFFQQLLHSREYHTNVVSYLGCFHRSFSESQIFSSAE